MHARAHTRTRARAHTQAWRQLREHLSLWTDLVVHGKAAKFDGYFDPSLSQRTHRSTAHNARILSP
jgi:hypothetical protein